MTRVRWRVLGNAKIARDFVIPALRAARNGDVVALASRERDSAAAVAEQVCYVPCPPR